MQVNGNNDFPQILYYQDQDLDTRSMQLKPGYIYEIEVSASGQVSTPGFKELSREVRRCRLENEVDQDSIFKSYSQSNCRYLWFRHLNSESLWDWLWLFSFADTNAISKRHMSIANVFHGTLYITSEMPKNVTYLDEHAFSMFMTILYTTRQTIVQNVLNSVTN